MSASPGLSLKARVDLHTHSLHSDGKYAPAVVLRRAALGGLNVLAITDHDLPPSLPWGAVRVAGAELRVVHGVEISATHRGTEQHLLVWFPEQMPEAFAAWCRSLCAARAERYAEAVRSIGLDGLSEPTEDAWRGERSLTRYHLASALVEAGHASGLGVAFARWAGEGCGYVPTIRLELRDAIGVAREAGGYTSWAHPDPDQAKVWVAELAAAGLHALEAHRPGLNRAFREDLARLGFKHGLGVTGGSDWHGWVPGALGGFSLPLRSLDGVGQALGLL